MSEGVSTPVLWSPPHLPSLLLLSLPISLLFGLLRTLMGTHPYNPFVVRDPTQREKA